jgi:hypothetical protein
MTSCSNTSIQASALTLSPAPIALQNITYNAKSLVQFRLLAIWLASSNNNKALLLAQTLLLLSDIISEVMTLCKRSIMSSSLYLWRLADLEYITANLFRIMMRLKEVVREEME